MTKLRGIFDVDAIALSPFVGKWTTIPSLPVEASVIVEEEDDEWELM